MFVASVYFDHHWIVDGVLGWAVAVVAVIAARKVLARWPMLSSAGEPLAEHLVPEAAAPQRSGLPVAAPPKVL
jgi:hypothetical protein